MYIYGTGGHSRVVSDVLKDSGITVRQFLYKLESTDVSGMSQTRFGVQRPSLRSFKLLDEPLIICTTDNQQRLQIAKKFKVYYGNVIHPSSIICKNVPIGEGTVILHGAIVQSRAKIGKHVLLNAACSVGHDSIINDYVHILPGATICGHVVVGEGASIGAGAVIIPGITIGKWSVVEAGAVVVNDVPAFSIAGGCPAKVLNRKRINNKTTLCAMF